MMIDCKASDTMFHSLMLSTKTLFSQHNNSCIYSDYKLYVQKYLRMKQVLKQKTRDMYYMKRKIKSLEVELKNMCDLKDDVGILRDKIEYNDIIKNNLEDKIQDDTDEEMSEDMCEDEPYELVCV